MSSEDVWQRKYHELWEKLEDNTKSSFCTALWKWLVLMYRISIMLVSKSTSAYLSLLELKHTCVQAWCDAKGLDSVIHPIIKCVVFLEDLLEEMVAKKSLSAQSKKGPFRHNQSRKKSTV